MSNKNDGGPAFPVSNATELLPSTITEYERFTSGMALRDYFAAKAMQGIMSADWEMNTGNMTGDIARNAYAIADVLIAERSKQP